MAIEKMKFIRAYGPVGRVDEFISACCLSGELHPENALDYMSASMGFSSMGGENPYSARIQRMEELADIASAELDGEADLTNVSEKGFDDSLIDEMMETMQSLHRRHTALSEQLAVCEKEREQYSHFTDLDTSMQDLIECRFVSVRFGSMPTECLEKLAAYQERESFVFVVCEKTATDVRQIVLDIIAEIAPDADLSSC